MAHIVFSGCVKGRGGLRAYPFLRASVMSKFK